MTTYPSTQEIIEQKVKAFDELQPEFEQCFLFVGRMHGQERISAFAASDAVRYLHALWVCECKTYLLSIAQTVKVYDGITCLDLLQRWQEEGDTAGVVEFLQRKLEMLPFAEITRQIHEAQQGRDAMVSSQRLLYGRMALLNRGLNLMHLLEALFAPAEEELLKMVQDACQYYNHLPAQIIQQKETLSSQLYAYVPHRRLAQRNMLVMNKLSMDITAHSEDRPGQRSVRVVNAYEPLPPYAEEVIPHYEELTAPWHNNLRADRFVYQPQRGDSEAI